MADDSTLTETSIIMSFYPALFLDNMLIYVFTKLGFSRILTIIHGLRSEYLLEAPYTFSSEIGDALVRILETFNNIAESTVAFSNLLLRTEEETGVSSQRVVNLLKCHEVSSLTDADFDHNSRVWCSQLLHYLAIVSSLCLYYERDLHIIASIGVMGEASQLLHRLMEERASEKIESLKQYASSTLNEPPLTHTTIYDLY